MYYQKNVFIVFKFYADDFAKETQTEKKNHFPDSKDNTIFIFLKFVHIVIAAVEANYYKNMYIKC